MTYLRALRALAAIVRFAMRHVDVGSKVWAILADWDGHISFRQIDYVKRVRRAVGWRPVTIVSGQGWAMTAPPTTTYGALTTSYTWHQSGEQP